MTFGHMDKRIYDTGCRGRNMCVPSMRLSAWHALSSWKLLLSIHISGKEATCSCSVHFLDFSCFRDGYLS